MPPAASTPEIAPAIAVTAETMKGMGDGLSEGRDQVRRARPVRRTTAKQARDRHRRLQAGGTFDRQIDRARRFCLYPVAEAAKRSVGGNRRANAGAEGVKGGVTGRTLHDRLDLGPVLVVVAQRRQRHLGLPRFAVAQDHKTRSGHAFGQHVTAQSGCRQCRKPRVQRGEDGLAGSGHVRTRSSVLLKATLQNASRVSELQPLTAKYFEPYAKSAAVALIWQRH